MTNRKVAPGRRVIRGTKNVFADLGFPDADVRQVKLRLAYCVSDKTRSGVSSVADSVFRPTYR